MPYQLATCRASSLLITVITRYRSSICGDHCRGFATLNIISGIELTKAKHIAQGTPTETCHSAIHDAQHLAPFLRLQTADGGRLFQKFL